MVALLIAACLGQPPAFAEAMAALDAGRAAIGRPPLIWDDRLARSAQELADWGWDAYLSGSADVSADAHHDFLGRLRRAGLDPRRTSECGIPGTGQRRGEDGKDYPRDPSGWRHPWKTAASHARWTAWVLTASNLARDHPDEGHVADFRAAESVGIGYRGGIFVLDYGFGPAGRPRPARQVVHPSVPPPAPPAVRPVYSVDDLARALGGGR